MKYRAFSLAELLISMLILAIMTGAFTLGTNIGRNTAKREAEKIVARLHSMTERAARQRANFKMTIDNGSEINFVWQLAGKSMQDSTDTPYTASKGLSLSWNAPNQILTYKASDSDFSHQGATITITRDDGQKHYVVISTGGRVRVSVQPGSGNPEKDYD